MDKLDTIQEKPEHLIGVSTGFSIKAFRSMYEGIISRCGNAPDTVACGSKALAEDAYSAAKILGYPLAVIVDEEISPRRYYLVSAEDLGTFPGGGRN